MKQILTILFFVVSISVCVGQINVIDYSKIIKEEAQIMMQFLLKKDFSSFSRYTYPKILEMMGGKQKMVEMMEKDSKKMQSDGFEFQDIALGEPSEIITIGNELQCTVSQIITIKSRNGKLITESTLIAVSTNNGKNWSFIDTSGKNIQTLKKILPNLSDKLVIPERKQPVFYPD